MGSCDPEMLVSHKTDRIPRHQLRPSRSQDVSARRLAVSAVCLSALMCVAMVVYIQVTTKTMSDKLSSVEEELVYMRQVVSWKHEIPEWLNENEEKPSKILYRQERSPKNQPRKRPKPPAYVPPYIHLFGKKNDRRHTEKDYIFFTWDKAGLNPGSHGFDLEGDSEGGYYKIRVRHPGVYLIYAQVAVHGRDNVNKPYECSHETVCTKQTGERIVLLSSLVTQYQLSGGSYEKNEENQGLRALDTKVHMGVFMLQTGDVLSVQIPPSCENMEYSMTPQQSYFGLAQLNNHKEKTNKPNSGERRQTKPPKRKNIH